jgi:hypothetical protein
MSGHSKLPWSVEHANGAHPAFVSIYADLGELGAKHVAAVGNGEPWAENLDEWLANASLIVRSVNAHDALVEALEDARTTLATLHELASMMSDRNWRDLMVDIQRHASFRFDRIDSALASAKGTTE